MEKTIETNEVIKVKDPYDLNIDPFTFEDTPAPSEDITEIEETEEKEIKGSPTALDTDVFGENNNDAPEDTDKEVKEEDKEEQQEEQEEELDEGLRLRAAVGGLRLLAELKGVEKNINFDKIENVEDVEEILETFGQLDVEIAKEELKQKSATIAQITDFLDKGGNKDEILSHLTKTEDIASVDISTESGAKKIVKDYLKNVVGFSDEVVLKKLKKLEDSDSLISEAEDVLPLYQDHLNKELQQKTDKLEAKKRDDLIQLQQKQTSFIESLKANKYNRETATELYNTAFREVAMPSGDKKILLDAKIEKLKDNPETFLKLVSFINNPENYDKQVLANKGSQIVTDNTRRKLIINSKPKEAATSVPKEARESKFQLKF